MISPEPHAACQAAQAPLKPARAWPATFRACVLAACLMSAIHPVHAAPVGEVLETPAQTVDERLPVPVLSVARAGEALIGVGPHGVIQRSVDAGQNWQQVTSPVSSDLVQVRFIDDRNGWIVGHDSLVMHSSDAGKSWQVQLDGRSLLTLLHDYYQPLADKGDDAAAQVLNEVATASGSTATPGVLAAPFLDVLFDGHGNGFVAGAFGMLLHSTDNGAHWQPWVERSDNERRMHLYGLAQRDGVFYISGEQGLLLKQDVAGERFTHIELPYAGTLFGVAALNDVLLVHGLRGNLYASRDEGQQWQKIDTGIASSLVNIISQGNRWLVVGQGGELAGLDRRTLEVNTLPRVPGGEVYGASDSGKPGELLVSRFSGAKVVNIATAE
ncbi:MULTISPECIES: WD40/YVTN/BNR-like repeat-containing protein [unclassified Pseudomonas]|uniref:WD40/YVTN/BNR-like repeat-containing protein n=1 Tax=unclassified Pseudomonas TaxID=196821 RepID=UPI0025D66B8F|nr:MULTISPECIES: YCF48-related protein [unclassified Pseudomonas]